MAHVKLFTNFAWPQPVTCLHRSKILISRKEWFRRRQSAVVLRIYYVVKPFHGFHWNWRWHCEDFLHDSSWSYQFILIFFYAFDALAIFSVGWEGNTRLYPTLNFQLILGIYHIAIINFNQKKSFKFFFSRWKIWGKKSSPIVKAYFQLPRDAIESPLVNILGLCLVCFKILHTYMIYNSVSFKFILESFRFHGQVFVYAQFMVFWCVLYCDMFTIFASLFRVSSFSSAIID